MDGQRSRGTTDSKAPVRVTFVKQVLGLGFPVACVQVDRARDLDRARRAAELKFSRRYGVHWRMRADAQEIEAA